MLDSQYKIIAKTMLCDNACILVWCKNFEITQITSVKKKIDELHSLKIKLHILVLLKRNPTLFTWYIFILHDYPYTYPKKSMLSVLLADKQLDI